MEYKKTAHSVHLLTYHLIFVTKYRRPVISNAIGDFLKNHAAYLCQCANGSMLSAETDRDHIHILVELPPNTNLSEFINMLKGQLSREVRKAYGKEISKYLYGNTPFWSPSYFVATTGSVSMETVKAYIESQRTDEHKRKYEKTGKFKKREGRRNSSPT